MSGKKIKEKNTPSWYQRSFLARLPAWVGYAAAVLSVIAVWGLRTLLDPLLMGLHPNTLFFFPVLFVSWWAGLGPATLATILGWVVGDYFFLEPRYTFLQGGAREFTAALIYLLICTGLILATYQMRKAQHKVSRILDRVTDAFLALDGDWRFTHVNAEAERVLQKSAAQLLGKRIWEVFPHSEGFRAQYERSMATNVAAHFEMNYEPLHAWFEVHAYPASDGLSVYFRDITRRKQVEADLARERSFVEAVLQACPAAVIVAAPGGKVIRTNPANERLWGPSPVTESVSDYKNWRGWWADQSEHHGQQLQAHEWALARALQGEVCPGDIVEIEPFDAPGNRRIITNSGAPVRNSEGEIIGAVIAQQDITEGKRAEDALQKSEERYRLVNEATHDVIWDWDLTNNNVFWSDAIQRTFGFSPSEVGPTAIWWKEQIHPEDRERVVRSIHRVIDDPAQRTWSAEYRLLHREGHWVDVFDRGLVARDREGRAIRMIGSMLDVSERKQTEAALHLAIQRFEVLANTMPQIVWSTRPDGYHDYFNDRWYEFTGMPREEGQGWNWSDYLHPDDIPGTLQVWKHSLATGEPYEVQYRFRRAKDGLYRWFIGRALPIHDQQGHITRWFGTCTDISEMREVQERLRDLKNQLARVNEQLERKVDERTAKLQETIADLEHFSYTVTHDLRAPLRAMKGFAQILMEESEAHLTPSEREYISKITTSATRMDILIRDALNYTKLARQEFSLSPIDVEALLREMIQSYPEFSPAHIDIQIQSPLMLLQANRAGLTQCFSNIIQNAAKFAKPGQKPKLVIRSEQRYDRVRLWFQDNGVGLPQKFKNQVFQMFTQLHKGYAGTGVGLALVRKAAERMGGSVGVECEGEGCRFWLEFQTAAESRSQVPPEPALAR